jgi:hypothetical protein
LVVTGRYDQSVTGYTYTVRETRNWLQTFVRRRPILHGTGFLGHWPCTPVRGLGTAQIRKMRKTVEPDGI